MSNQCLFLIIYILVLTVIIFAEDCKHDKCEPNNEIRYLLYDVNPPEGFNLKRDVYMRMAILIKHLQDMGQRWKLVLPPWGNMYHWQSKDIGDQNRLPWSLFFDIPSMRKFIPVLEMYEFLEEYGRTHLDQVFYLQHFTNMWSEGKWEEKMNFEPCSEEIPYKEESTEHFKGWFWGYRNISASSVKCLSFQGHATYLIPLLINITDGDVRTVMLDKAEIALHHMFGDPMYWQVRRSMRFANHLVDIASEFRRQYLDSNDREDNTVRPSDWQLEKQLDTSEKRGGNYMCIHLRRRDFLLGRSKSVPSIIGAAVQISKQAKKNNLDIIFLATDGKKDEIKELKSLMKPLKIVLFKPDGLQRKNLKDGGIAIVEQIICTHARIFIGTFESTFSFRIQEEREIMGFHPDNTFLRLCGDDEECTPPSRWRIEY